MNLIRRNLPLLVLILFVYLFYFASTLIHPTPPPAVLGVKTKVVLFEQPEAGREPIISAINTARKQILVEMYLMSDKEIIGALTSARSRGVQVKVMLEQHPFGGGGLNQKTEKILEKSGIEIKWTNPSFALTHEKGIVIDESASFILNQNLTASAFGKNREYDVLDYNRADVLEQEEIFNSDWERKSFKPPEGGHLVVSPINARASLTSLITKASTSIDIEAEEIEDPQIIELLMEKARNVPQRIIVPSFSQLSANRQAISKLKRAGASVRILSSPYVHAKLIVEDGKEAYVGSVNLSAQSMDENRELGILLQDPAILGSLLTSFENDWNHAQSP